MNGQLSTTPIRLAEEMLDLGLGIQRLAAEASKLSASVEILVIHPLLV
jgi:hypothetical protein